MVRNAVQSVWDRNVLTERSVGGKLAPTYCRSACEPFRELTLAKVNIIYAQNLTLSTEFLFLSGKMFFALLSLQACVDHWAMLHNENVAVMKGAVPKMLASKIRDVRKRLPFSARRTTSNKAVRSIRPKRLLTSRSHLEVLLKPGLKRKACDMLQLAAIEDTVTAVQRGHYGTTNRQASQFPKQKRNIWSTGHLKRSARAHLTLNKNAISRPRNSWT